jgi:hypothetical protein
MVLGRLLIGRQDAAGRLYPQGEETECHAGTTERSFGGASMAVSRAR